MRRAVATLFATVILLLVVFEIGASLIDLGFSRLARVGRHEHRCDRDDVETVEDGTYLGAATVAFTRAFGDSRQISALVVGSISQRGLDLLRETTGLGWEEWPSDAAVKFANLNSPVFRLKVGDAVNISTTPTTDKVATFVGDASFYAEQSGTYPFDGYAVKVSRLMFVSAERHLAVPIAINPTVNCLDFAMSSYPAARVRIASAVTDSTEPAEPWLVLVAARTWDHTMYPLVFSSVPLVLVLPMLVSRRNRDSSSARDADIGLVLSIVAVLGLRSVLVPSSVDSLTIVDFTLGLAVALGLLAWARQRPREPPAHSLDRAAPGRTTARQPPEPDR